MGTMVWRHVVQASAVDAGNVFPTLPEQNGPPWQHYFALDHHGSRGAGVGEGHPVNEGVPWGSSGTGRPSCEADGPLSVDG